MLIGPDLIRVGLGLVGFSASAATDHASGHRLKKELLVTMTSPVSLKDQGFDTSATQLWNLDTALLVEEDRKSVV